MIRTWTRVLGTLCMVGALGAHAQGAGTQVARFPLKPVRVLVGFGAGGAVDVQARLIAQRLAEAWAQAVIVENRPGADGILAADAVAKSAPDGHTVVYVSAGHAMNSILHARTIPYHPINDFSPVSLVASGPLTLVVHPSLPVRDLKELVVLARARPGKLNFASAGSGGTMHLAGELLKTMANIDIVHVPYKGGSQAVTDVLGGQVELTFVGAPASMPHIRSGRLKVLAVTSARRSAALPDVPTVAELGYRDYEVGAWYGMLAAARTPASIVGSISADVAAAVNAPAVRAKLLALGIEPLGSTPIEFTDHLRKEIARWGPVIQKAGIKGD